MNFFLCSAVKPEKGISCWEIMGDVSDAACARFSDELPCVTQVCRSLLDQAEAVVAALQTHGKRESHL